MFDNPVDITARYGATRVTSGTHKKTSSLSVARPVKAPLTGSRFVYAEYIEMRKTPEFWQWWKRQYAKQDAKCYYCLESLKNRRVNVEHIVPMSKGGTNAKRNMVISCVDCNRAKGSRLLPKKRRNQFRRRLSDAVRSNTQTYRANRDYQTELASWYRRNFE